ncbi:ribonuclease H [Longibacter salinarum]|uniref:Ribonuclease H n=2 Tax=Longibacter salinarum TaxID=1850348 RepID=A0A2A8CU38_9BACT|nr:ribonuclease H [Longibacter salinarum]
MVCVAWDIETCPQPLSALTDTQKERYETEMRQSERKKPDLDHEDRCRLVRSTHPLLGWICCISAVSGTLDGQVNDPVSWTAATEDDEVDLFLDFWSTVAGFSRGVTWVTFNGKRFDVPFLLARSARRDVSPTRRDLTDTYPYNNRPHTDLCNLWPASYSLADLCEHLYVDSPKDGFDGSKVADAVEEGRIEQMQEYCERDVVATLKCAQAARAVLRLD